MSAPKCGIALADPQPAAEAVATVCAENEPTHRERERRQPVTEHVQHAVVHLRAWQAGDRREDHLGDAATGVLMALQHAKEGGR